MAVGGLRARLYQQLEPAAWPHSGLSVLNKALIITILFASIIAIIETEPTVTTELGWFFNICEPFFALFFLLEYALRFWTAAERQNSGWRGRWHFFRSPSGLLDLFIVVATLLPVIAPNVVILRLLRLMRILAIAKLGRFSDALQVLRRAIFLRRYELGLTVLLSCALLIFGATALYWLEGELQPDKFGSIPRALWWAIITLTTIGYGDVYPLTALGRLVASLVAVTGIGLVAMPTGILAAAFSEALQAKSTGENT
jgi:voltage-gated potassium channel